MKRPVNTKEEIKKFDQFVTILTEKEILCLQAMSRVRGGSDGDGGEPIIIIPPPFGH